MAGKHSKSIFGFKSVYVTEPTTQKKTQTPISLPFKIIIAILVFSLLLSSVFVGVFFSQSSRNKNLLSDAAEIFADHSSNNALQILSDINPDIKGWLKIDGANINYAVCQGDNDSYYINHNQLGKKSRYGALFLSANDNFDRKDNDKNLVIFGNNMKDGSMFGSLKKYRNLNFYKQNPDIQLYYGDESETYIIFAVMLTSASSADDDNTSYMPTKSHFADENDFNVWYNETCARSLINTTVKAQYGDDILTLVTVADDFDGARLIVMAKKTTEWEISHTDVSSATVNAKTKYPKIWYTNKGLSYPY